MKVQRIRRIRNYRSFVDFAWTNDLPDFSRFNLIYGWNGSGKTCLSNLFRHLQEKKEFNEGEVEFQLDGHPVPGTAIPTAVLPQVRVFNRDTVDRSVFEIPNRQLPPIYVFGEDSAPKQRELQILNEALDQAKKSEADMIRAVTTTETAFEQFCADRAQNIKNLLTAAGGGAYNFYNKGDSKKTVTRLISGPHMPLTEEERQQYICGHK